MTQKQKFPGKRRFPIVTVLVAVVAAGVLLAVGGVVFAAGQESHDSFCASCHSMPESTFFQRSTGVQPVDLASYHTTQKTRCIDCHSGQGVTGRIQAELLGVGNALKWYTGTAIQPAPLNDPISDSNCLKCHQAVTQRGYTPKEQITVPGTRGGGREERTGHWHQFLSRWQATASYAGTCTSCHSGHVTDGNAQSGYMVEQTVQGVCEACHQVLRREGEG